MRSRMVAVFVGSAVCVTACGDTDRSLDIALPLVEPTVVPLHTGPSENLAPSQIAASTVPAPDLPDHCELADLDFWTAAVSVTDRSADAVIRVRNRGQVRCEVDIRDSPLIDPVIEPTVWLDPGGWADLIVGPSGDDCRESTAVSLVQIDVHGEAVVVPSAAVATCGWRLTAFFPNDVAVEPCELLETATVNGFVLVRNPTFRPCVLGELSGVDADTVSGSSISESIELSVLDLAGGDVLAFVQLSEPAVDCADDLESGVLTFTGAGTVAVDALPCGAVYQLGAGRPWFGDSNGPLSALEPGSFDLDAALDALDPFEVSR